MSREQILRVEAEITQLNETLKLCEKVAQTTATPGWKEIVLPLLEKMIIDVIGGKLANGKWTGGLLSKARTDEKREFHLGYKQALIDLHTRIYAYENNIELIKRKRETLIKSKDQGSTRPMIDDTRYGKDQRYGKSGN